MAGRKVALTLVFIATSAAFQYQETFAKVDEIALNGLSSPTKRRHST
jgi:hypothetical protein